MAKIRPAAWRVLLLTALLALGLAASAQADTYSVTDTTDSPASGTGSTCTTAGPCTLRQAVTAANDTAGADTINVAPGTYKLDNGDLFINTDVTIAGHEATDTIIDAQNKSRVFDLGGSGGGPGSTVSISNLTMQNGAPAKTSFCSGDGGAIISTNTALTLSHVAVRNSSAFFDGGGVFVEGVHDQCSDIPTPPSGLGATAVTPSLTIDHSEISGNQAGERGGGVSVFVVPVTITDSTVGGNQAGGSGG